MKNYFSTFWVSGLLLAACADPKPVLISQEPTAPVVLQKPLELSEVSGYGPEQILTLLDTSKLHYTIQFDHELPRYDLKSYYGQRHAPSPFWYVERDSNALYLRARQEPPCAFALDTRALEAFAAHDYDKSLAFYRQSLRCAPSHVKTLTWIGNVFLVMGRLDSATFYLRQAIEANSLDYQAHYFLADAYLRMGEARLARSSILHAMVLSGGNLNVMRSAENVLRATGEEIYHQRLLFDFGLRYTSNEVHLVFRDSSASSLVLAACFAAWEREDAFREFKARDDSVGQIRLRHCLLDQALAARSLVENGRELDEGSAYLLDVLDAGLLGPMVLWEVLAGMYPQVVYLVSDAERAELYRYIERFVVRRMRR